MLSMPANRAHRRFGAECRDRRRGRIFRESLNDNLVHYTTGFRPLHLAPKLSADRICTELTELALSVSRAVMNAVLA